VNASFSTEKVTVQTGEPKMNRITITDLSAVRPLTEERMTTILGGLPPGGGRFPSGGQEETEEERRRRFQECVGRLMKTGRYSWLSAVKLCGTILRKPRREFGSVIF
jgi:hypothetical protein